MSVGKAKPSHYRVVCLSIYTKDLIDLDHKVELLKRHGWSRANRSHLVRIALARLSEADLSTIADVQQRGP